MKDTRTIGRRPMCGKEDECKKAALYTAFVTKTYFSYKEVA